MKKAILSLLIPTILLSGCSNLLTYHKRKNWKEKNCWQQEEAINISQTLSCSASASPKRQHRWRQYHRGYSHQLSISVLDLENALGKGRLIIPADSSIITVDYNRNSAHNWGTKNETISGWIEIVEVGPEILVLNENLLVVTTLEKIRFNGKREIKRGTDKNQDQSKGDIKPIRGFSFFYSQNSPPTSLQIPDGN